MSGFDSDSDSDPTATRLPSAFDEAIQDPESVWHQNSGHFDSLALPLGVRQTKLGQRGYAVSEELGGWVGRFDTDADSGSE